MEVGIKRIHQKLFAEGIKKRLLYSNTKKIINLTKPNVGGVLTERWMEADKISNDVIKKLPSINKSLNTNLIKC